jgi:hypothetical protein
MECRQFIFHSKITSQEQMLKPTKSLSESGGRFHPLHPTLNCCAETPGVDFQTHFLNPRTAIKCMSLRWPEIQALYWSE